jgi:peptide/nickel transport system permease protein
MWIYLAKRILALIPTLILIMLVSFIIMQLPPADFVDQYINREAARGNVGVADQEAMLREQFGLDQPLPLQFVNWVGGVFTGNFGISFADKREVSEIIMDRLPATLAIASMAFLLSWGIGIPLGVYSATHQYRAGDVALTGVAFVGIGLPDFLLALIFLVVAFYVTGDVLLGLSSPEFVGAPLSWDKFVDFMSYAWLSVVAVAFTGMAYIMRVTRNNMLEELGKPYVMTLRAKGLPERVVIWRHVFRNAIHPLVMLFGQVLSFLINGFAITSVVLNLPTVQATYLQATLLQDTYLAGAILVLIALTVMLGNLISDLLLAWIDPRVRYD